MEHLVRQALALERDSHPHTPFISISIFIPGPPELREQASEEAKIRVWKLLLSDEYKTRTQYMTQL